MDLINKYIKIYLKRNFYLALFCAIIVFLPFFIVSLFYDAVKHDILISFVPFLLCGICFAIASLSTIRFKKMIKEQAFLYATPFQDAKVVCLENTLFLSRDWLISAGRVALYKEHIVSIHSRLRGGRAGFSNQVTIKTVDQKKYTVWCLSASNVKEIIRWKHS